MMPMPKKMHKSNAITKEQLLSAVYRHPLITEMDLEKICRAHEKIAFKKNSFLLKNGETASEYFIVESGLMRSFVTDTEGHDITTNFFGEGEIVIEVSSLFQRIPTRENIQALTNCICWKIDYDAFQQLYHSIKGFSEWGRGWMAGELFRFKQRSMEMIAESATTRYLKLIKEKPHVIQQAPLKHIATYLGVTDTSLSRIRKEMI